jgi:phosphatidylserine/phosphatidylglycerophosphate/cardiolipin synthase-like enzyme
MPPVRPIRKSAPQPPPRRRSSIPAGLSLLILAGVFVAFLVQSISDKPQVTDTPQIAGTSPATETTQTPVQNPASAAAATWYRLFFTHPQEANTAGPDQALTAAILSAQHSVDIAAYSLSLEDVRDALLSVYRRGVKVRLVMESDNLNETVPNELASAGIPILGDRREGLMHNKFAIIDNQEVWTGSMNFTTSGVADDNNNLIAIPSTDLAEDYTTEFDEMFVDDKFGPGSPSNTPHPSLTLGGSAVEVYFSPDDGVTAHLLEMLAGAKKSIYFLAYSFTADDLAQTILDRAAAGVEVGGVMDESQVRSNQGTEYYKFRDAGLDVVMDGNPGLMHHKVIIVDGKTVAFGSYNFSASAEDSNDENLLIVHDAGLAQRFMQEYQEVYDLGRPNPK